MPLQEFQENLQFIISEVQKFGISKDKMILVSPPKYYADEVREIGRTSVGRSTESAAAYAAACVQVGQQLGITCVDLFSAFDADERGRSLTRDGLHFSAAGSQLMFEQVWPWIELKVKEYHGTPSLEQNLPYWMEFRDSFQQTKSQSNSPPDGKHRESDVSAN